MIERVLVAFSVVLAILATGAGLGILSVRSGVVHGGQRLDESWRAIEASTQRRVAAAQGLAERHGDAPRRMAYPPPEEIIALDDVSRAISGPLAARPRSADGLRCFRRAHRRFDEAVTRLRRVLESGRRVASTSRLAHLAAELAATDEPAATARAAFAREFRAHERLLALAAAGRRLLTLADQASRAQAATTAPAAKGCGDDPIDGIAMLFYRQVKFADAMREVNVALNGGHAETLAAFSEASSAAYESAGRLDHPLRPRALPCLDAIEEHLHAAVGRLLERSRLDRRHGPEFLFSRYLAAVSMTDADIAQGLRDARARAGPDVPSVCPAGGARRG